MDDIIKDIENIVTDLKSEDLTKTSSAKVSDIEVFGELIKDLIGGAQ